MVDDKYATQYENKHEDINDFIERKRDLGRSERTLKEYSRTLREFFHEIVPDVPPVEVTVEHVEDYLRELSSPERACAPKRSGGTSSRCRHSIATP